MTLGPDGDPLKIVPCPNQCHPSLCITALNEFHSMIGLFFASGHGGGHFFGPSAAAVRHPEFLKFAED